MTMGVLKPYHHIRLTRQAKYDLKVWQDFLEHFNGRSMFLNYALLTGDCLQLYTDAAGGKGFGAICGTEWFHGLCLANDMACLQHCRSGIVSNSSSSVSLG